MSSEAGTFLTLMEQTCRWGVGGGGVGGGDGGTGVGWGVGGWLMGERKVREVTDGGR